MTTKNSLSRAGFELAFSCDHLLQCQINMNLVFHISEDGSEIELRPQRQALSCHENISCT